jgi:hypothetical protein
MIIAMMFVLTVVAFSVMALYLETVNAEALHAATESGYSTVNDLAYLHRVSIINKKLGEFRA